MTSAANDYPRRKDDEATGYRDVPCPSRHDGVGSALRRSYAVSPQPVPDQWQKLLDRLG